MLLVVKGWRHQLAILPKNGSYIRFLKVKFKQTYVNVYITFLNGYVQTNLYTNKHKRFRNVSVTWVLAEISKNVLPESGSLTRIRHFDFLKSRDPPLCNCADPDETLLSVALQLGLHNKFSIFRFIYGKIY